MNRQESKPSYGKIEHKPDTTHRLAKMGLALMLIVIICCLMSIANVAVITPSAGTALWLATIFGAFGLAVG